MNFQKILDCKEYEFLKTNKSLGQNLILVGVAGSHAYGTNIADSDIDIRGVTLNQKSDLLGMTHFEQYVDDNTDTTIYSFRKMIYLLMGCNPNTCEILGLKKEHYLFLSDIGQELLNHKSMFLSKLAIHSFGGYAGQQLRRLQNALARDSFSQSEKERHILNSIKNAMYDFQNRYTKFTYGAIQLYVDQAEKTCFDTEIFMDVHLKHYPVRDYNGICSELQSIVKNYDKIGKRNHKKDDNHLNKHAMHLIRLFMMAIDILEKEEINTFREQEQELLLQIRNGVFQNEKGEFRTEFYDLLSEYEKRLEYASEHTSLPDEPNYKVIEEFVISVNERVVNDIV